VAVLKTLDASRSRLRALTSRSIAVEVSLESEARQRPRPHLPASLPSSTTASARSAARLWVSSTVRPLSVVYELVQQLMRANAAFLYEFAGPAGALNDVTIGKNVGQGCNDSAVAFSAQKGWDPTTGASCRA
jgi:hypothetical protein